MKPYTICHMMMSLDGRIDCAMTVKIPGGDEYYKTLSDLHSDADICGRVTAETEMADGKFTIKSYIPYNKEEVYLDHSVSHYDVIIDTKGSLLWNDSKNLIIVVSKQVSTEYIEYLKNNHINYIVAGETNIDLNKVSEILYEKFNVKRMAIVGGGNINGGYLKANLIDEISVVLGPAVDGRSGFISLFDGLDLNKEPTKLNILDLKRLNNDVIYLRYKVTK